MSDSIHSNPYGKGFISTCNRLGGHYKKGKIMDKRKERFEKLYFDLTHLCNKNCLLCGKKVQIGNYSMTKEEYKYIVSCIKDPNDIKFIDLGGGEPMCHPHFKWIIEEMLIDFPKTYITVQTNGKILSYIEKNMKEIFNNKRVRFLISVYRGWNDDIIKKYGSSILPIIPVFFRVFFYYISKLRIYQYFGERFILIDKFLSFLQNPFAKYHNILIRAKNVRFMNSFLDPNLDEKTAKRIREKCYWYIQIQGTRLYNCCMADVPEREFNIKSAHIKFDKDWKTKIFQIPTWRACQRCYHAKNIIDCEKILGKNKVKRYSNIRGKYKYFQIFKHDEKIKNENKNI